MPEKTKGPAKSLRPILLIEDNVDDIELTQKSLQRSGVLNELRVLTDGEQALDYLVGPGAVSRPLPAVVLLDLRLPKVDGLEVLKRIRTEPRTSQLPVVVLTESKVSEDWRAGYAWKAALIMAKPVAFDQLLNVAQGLHIHRLSDGQ